MSDVSFEVRAGEVVGYLGPNGSGKSTTAKMLTSLLETSAGTVLFDGQTSRLIRSTSAGASATAKSAVLQKYNRVNLVVPVDAPHMWHAAIESKAYKLTVLGEHYRSLIV